MRRTGFLICVVAGMLGAVAVFWPLGAASFSLLPGKTLIEHWTGSHWAKLSSPSPIGGDSLSGVAVLSRSMAWAVGVRGKNQTSHPLIERWNRSGWAVVPGPSTTGGSSLQGVAVLSPTSAWAVGSDGKGQPLIERWDGSSWKVAAAPNLRGSLASVAVSAANEAWAVGSRSNGKPLAEHWDGSAWTVVASPPAAGGSSLRGVTAISPTDVWAVGSSGANGGPTTLLTEHWDGVKWSIVKTPKVGAGGDLGSVTARRAADVFAAGSYLDSRGCLRTLVLRWRGSSWKVMKTPNPFSCDNELAGVAASPKAVVAVGNHPSRCPGSRCQNVTLALTLQRRGWKIESSASTSAKFNELLGAAMVPGRAEAWAVGVATNSFVQ